jgi:LuxR family transcriptional regulator, maltose regulon positive regulatory protein
LTGSADFLNQAMGLKLSADEVGTLESRTEGWIAGLQLAALSLQGHPDFASFIESFTGSHHFVLDYLLEEVLQRRPVWRTPINSLSARRRSSWRWETPPRH